MAPDLPSRTTVIVCTYGSSQRLGSHHIRCALPRGSASVKFPIPLQRPNYKEVMYLESATFFSLVTDQRLGVCRREADVRMVAHGRATTDLPNSFQRSFSSASSVSSSAQHVVLLTYLAMNTLGR